MNYNTDINIIGSIPDYHLIYKSLPLLYAKDDMLDKILVTDNEFNLRTEKSRKRFLSALSSAFVTERESLNNFVGELFAQQTIDEETKGIILFWLFSINNRLFMELNRDVFFKYMQQGRVELPVTDVIAYLKDVISRHDELKGRWSELTIKTIASKYLTALVKLNLLEGRAKKKFRFVRVTDEQIVCLIHMYTLLNQQGSNFLEHDFSKFMFVSEDSILDRLKKIGKKDWIKMSYTGTSLRVESALNTNDIINGIFRRT